MKAYDDGAPTTGCTETTTKVTCYQQPEYPFLVVWDLPGVGTPNFTRDTYFEMVNFKDYDFLLLVSSSSFKENDLWLSKEIVKSTQNINLLFIRSESDERPEIALLVNEERLYAIQLRINTESCCRVF
ncbi:hypothetical protein DPMN_074806 [Dreissena polymorpha]|uniref:IRG-type G domain-containing protein n=1 Tax=Dreissena polymorpha TaxID=45954 RepID=A0A9D4BKZ3_DREPO|nr:hypothetical protein DPMN_074806 [Dreissena polymorpha]